MDVWVYSFKHFCSFISEMCHWNVSWMENCHNLVAIIAIIIQNKCYCHCCNICNILNITGHANVFYSHCNVWVTHCHSWGSVTDSLTSFLSLLLTFKTQNRTKKKKKSRDLSAFIYFYLWITAALSWFPLARSVSLLPTNHPRFFKSPSHKHSSRCLVFITEGVPLKAAAVPGFALARWDRCDGRLIGLDWLFSVGYQLYSCHRKRTASFPPSPHAAFSDLASGYISGEKVQNPLLDMDASYKIRNVAFPITASCVVFTEEGLLNTRATCRQKFCQQSRRCNWFRLCFKKSTTLWFYAAW